MLRRPDPLPQRCQSVVTATLVVECGIGPLVGLLNQTVVEYPLARALQRARTHPHRATAQLTDSAAVREHSSS